MLLTSGGGRAGTISGGCLEKEVQKKAWWLTRSGPTVHKYSTFVDEDSEIPYGLGCSGTVSVLLERGEAADRTLAALEQSALRRTAMAIVSVIDTDPVGCRLILGENGDVLFESAGSEGRRSARGFQQFFPPFLSDLQNVRGDRGARGILERNAARVGAVDFLEGEFDLDTPDDLKRSTAFSGTAKWCPKLDL
jgi:hypothetical protein